MSFVGLIFGLLIVTFPFYLYVFGTAMLWEFGRYSRFYAFVDVDLFGELVSEEASKRPKPSFAVLLCQVRGMLFWQWHGDDIQE